MSAEKLILGYWAIRGRAGVLRNLLHYCEVPYINRLYKTNEEWYQKDKQELKFRYPNLPYIIDGKIHVTESPAIMHYIPLKGNMPELLGETDEKHIDVLEAVSVGMDLRDSLRRLVATKGDFEVEKERAFTSPESKMRAKLSQFDAVLSEKEWLTGNLTIADFYLFERVDMIHEIESSRLAAFPNLVSFRERFLQIPKVKAHRESENFIKLWQIPGTTVWNNGDKM